MNTLTEEVRLPKMQKLDYTIKNFSIIHSPRHATFSFIEKTNPNMNKGPRLYEKSHEEFVKTFDNLTAQERISYVFYNPATNFKTLEWVLDNKIFSEIVVPDLVCSTYEKIYNLLIRTNIRAITNNISVKIKNPRDNLFKEKLQQMGYACYEYAKLKDHIYSSSMPTLIKNIYWHVKF